MTIANEIIDIITKDRRRRKKRQTFSNRTLFNFDYSCTVSSRFEIWHDQWIASKCALVFSTQSNFRQEKMSMYSIRQICSDIDGRIFDCYFQAKCFFFCFSKSNKLKLCKCHCCLKWQISCRCEVLNHRKIIDRRNFLIEFITNDCENIASLSTWCSCRNKKKERAKLDLLIDWLMFYIYSEKKIRLTLLMSLIWSQIC